MDKKRRTQICERVLAREMEKRAGVFKAIGSAARGAFSTGSDIAAGFGRILAGKSRDAAGKLVTKGELAERLGKATGEEAVKIQRQLDAARFKQLAGWGGVGYLGYKGAVGAGNNADRRVQYMRQQYGTY